MHTCVSTHAHTHIHEHIYMVFHEIEVKYFTSKLYLYSFTWTYAQSYFFLKLNDVHKIYPLRARRLNKDSSITIGRCYCCNVLHICL